jgi:hypothetical protein
MKRTVLPSVVVVMATSAGTAADVLSGLNAFGVTPVDQ